MITLGIDMASGNKDTAACSIEWNGDSIVSLKLFEGCSDECLGKHIKESTVIGIDAPFGWPQPFVEALTDWKQQHWNVKIRDSFKFRATDKFLIDLGGGYQPLSVSADKLAIPAMRTATLLLRHNISDKSGTEGKFFEVYPAATLRRWNVLPLKNNKNKNSSVMKSYKGKENRSEREEIVGRLETGLKDLLPENFSRLDFAKSDHLLDALIASLTVRAASLRNTLLPTDDAMKRLAKIEGWIHIPEPPNILNCLTKASE